MHPIQIRISCSTNVALPHYSVYQLDETDFNPVKQSSLAACYLEQNCLHKRNIIH